jgi:hypothetical protein
MGLLVQYEQGVSRVPWIVFVNVHVRASRTQRGWAGAEGAPWCACAREGNSLLEQISRMRFKQIC